MITHNFQATLWDIQFQISIFQIPIFNFSLNRSIPLTLLDTQLFQ